MTQTAYGIQPPSSRRLDLVQAFHREVVLALGDRVIASIRTTGASSTVLATLQLPVDDAQLITVHVLGRQVDGSGTIGDSYGKVLLVSASPASVNSTVIFEQQDNSWTATASLSNAAIELAVVGESGKVIDWKAVLAIMKVGR